MPISPSLGGVSVPFLHRPGHMTKTKKFPKKSSANMALFLFQKFLKFGNQPTAFIKFDELIPVSHWSNDLPSWIGSRPRIFLTMSYIFRLPKIFCCRRIGEKNEKNNDFLEGKWHFFPTFWAHAD